MDSWFDEMGFKMDKVLEACSMTAGISNPNLKYVNSILDNWRKEACKEKGLNARIEIGEAAFYGPKLDFMVKDAIGRRWQLGTIQVDYNLPNRFKLEYTAENKGNREKYSLIKCKAFRNDAIWSR